MILTFIEAHSSGWFMPVIVGAAIADSINPCAFSILFLTIAFLLSLGKDRKFIMLTGGIYILGIAVVYTLIGIGILKVLSILSIPNVVARIGALILILYSVISLINEFFPSFPLKLKMPTSSHNLLGTIIHKASIPMAFVLGVLVGLFEFPCTGGPYLFVLSLLHDHGTFWSGFGYLIIYNIIFVLPLIIMLALAVNRIVLEKIDKLRKLETKKARIVLDFALLIVGAFIFLL